MGTLAASGWISGSICMHDCISCRIIDINITISIPKHDYVFVGWKVDAYVLRAQIMNCMINLPSYDNIFVCIVERVVLDSSSSFEKYASGYSSESSIQGRNRIFIWAKQIKGQAWSRWATCFHEYFRRINDKVYHSSRTNRRKAHLTHRNTQVAQRPNLIFILGAFVINFRGCDLHSSACVGICVWNIDGFSNLDIDLGCGVEGDGWEYDHWKQDRQ